MYWRVPDGSVAFGSGNRFSICRPIGLMRFAGILLSGKQPGPPVLTLHASPCAARIGSLIQRTWPALLNVCEKSPARSSAVGMVLSCSVPGSVRGSRSCEKKKNSLSRLWLKSVPGTRTGPPIVHAVLSKRYGGLRAARGLARVALTPAIPRVGVELFIALVVRRGAVEITRAALGDDGDRRARAAAVLGLEVGRLDLDLRDRIERRRGVVARVRAGVLVGHAVVGEVERVLAVDGHAAHRSPARGVTRGRVDDAGQRLEAAHEVAAFQADVLDLAGGDRRGTLAARGLDLDAFRTATVTTSDRPPTSRRDGAQRHALGGR